MIDECSQEREASPSENNSDRLLELEIAYFRNSAHTFPNEEPVEEHLEIYYFNQMPMEEDISEEEDDKETPKRPLPYRHNRSHSEELNF